MILKNKLMWPSTWLYHTPSSSLIFDHLRKNHPLSLLILGSLGIEHTSFKIKRDKNKLSNIIYPPSMDDAGEIDLFLVFLIISGCWKQLFCVNAPRTLDINISSTPPPLLHTNLVTNTYVVNETDPLNSRKIQILFHPNQILIIWNIRVKFEYL